MMTYDNETYRVLDFHTHYCGNLAGFDPTIVDIFERVQPKQDFNQRIVGRDPNALLDYFEKVGIDQACIFAEEGPPTHSSVHNSLCLGYAAQGQDRLFVIGNINPRIERNVGRRSAGLIDAGVKGFKFYASDHNQDPREPVLAPVYEQCNERGLPVLFHSGRASRYPLTNPEFGEPKVFEPLIRKYVNIPFVMCHGGKGGLHDECLRMVHQYPNTYIEISDVPFAILKQMCSDDLAARMIFGSDMPQFPNYDHLLKRVFRLPITAASRRKVLYENGARLLGL